VELARVLLTSPDYLGLGLGLGLGNKAIQFFRFSILGDLLLGIARCPFLSLGGVIAIWVQIQATREQRTRKTCS